MSATKTAPAPAQPFGGSPQSSPASVVTPPSPLKLATSPLEARLDELLNGDLVELRAHNPDGSFRRIPAAVEKQVGDIVHLVFGNGSRDAAPRGDCRTMKSFPEGDSALWGRYMAMVSPRLDAAFWQPTYPHFRGNIGIARFAQQGTCNMIVTIVTHIQKLNAIDRAAAARDAATQK